MVFLFYMMELFRLFQIGNLSKKSLHLMRLIPLINRNYIGI